MKKIILLLSAAVFMIACGGRSVEEKTIDYLNQIEAASNDYDYDAVEDITEEMFEWMAGLSEDEQLKVEKAMTEYHGFNEYATGEDGTDERDYEADEETEYVEASGNNWDKILDEYEGYVDDAIRLYSKAMNGDPDAFDEYIELSEKAEDLNMQISSSFNSLTLDQANRLNEITIKFADALQNDVQAYSASLDAAQNNWTDEYEDDWTEEYEDDWDEDDWDDEDEDGWYDEEDEEW